MKLRGNGKDLGDIKRGSPSGNNVNTALTCKVVKIHNKIYMENKSGTELEKKAPNHLCSHVHMSTCIHTCT